MRLSRMVKPVEFSVDELKDSFPTVYYDYIHDVRYEVQTIYLPAEANDSYMGIVGVKDMNDEFYIYDAEGQEGPGWYEVNFREMKAALSDQED